MTLPQGSLPPPSFPSRGLHSSFRQSSSPSRNRICGLTIAEWESSSSPTRQALLVSRLLWASRPPPSSRPVISSLAILPVSSSCVMREDCPSSAENDEDDDAPLLKLLLPLRLRLPLPLPLPSVVLPLRGWNKRAGLEVGSVQQTPFALALALPALDLLPSERNASTWVQASEFSCPSC